jgi:SAM-dependent methyltransferase
MPSEPIAALAETGEVPAGPVPVPAYLERVYWWAYVRPAAVRLFERQWLVDAILWGNFGRLCDTAIAALRLGDRGARKLLQVACVYGDLSQRIADVRAQGARYDVIDVLPVQLRNLRRKLGARRAVRLLQRDAAATGFADASYDRTLLFFLLHEQPAAVRRRTLLEAARVTAPGGRLVVVDYHRPRGWHPLRPLMHLVLRLLEPFALDLWRGELTDLLAGGPVLRLESKQLFFGGLYQCLVLVRE